MFQFEGDWRWLSGAWVDSDGASHEVSEGVSGGPFLVVTTHRADGVEEASKVICLNNPDGHVTLDWGFESFRLLPQAGSANLHWHSMDRDVKCVWTWTREQRKPAVPLGAAAPAAELPPSLEHMALSPWCTDPSPPAPSSSSTARVAPVGEQRSRAQGSRASGTCQPDPWLLDASPGSGSSSAALTVGGGRAANKHNKIQSMELAAAAPFEASAADAVVTSAGNYPQPAVGSSSSTSPFLEPHLPAAVSSDSTDFTDFAAAVSRVNDAGHKRYRANLAPPHFCIFQGDAHGINGWSLADGSRRHRWDTLLDVLLKCVMVDGKWPREVKASLFTGPDAIHISGAIQPFAMPHYWRSDGTQGYTPATFNSWQDVLWKNKGIDKPGLRWEIRGGPRLDISQARQSLFERLDTMLETNEEYDESIAIILDYKDVDVAYEELRMMGYKSEPRSTRVYLLLGGAHGFDGKDDLDAGMFKAIVGCFQKRLGANRVVRTNLCADAEELTKFTSTQVAAFLSTEYRRGALSRVVAGAETWLGLVAPPGGNSEAQSRASGAQVSRLPALLQELPPPALREDCTSSPPAAVPPPPPLLRGVCSAAPAAPPPPAPTASKAGGGGSSKRMALKGMPPAPTTAAPPVPVAAPSLGPVLASTPPFGPVDRADRDAAAAASPLSVAAKAVGAATPGRAARQSEPKAVARPSAAQAAVSNLPAKASPRQAPAAAPSFQAALLEPAREAVPVAASANAAGVTSKTAGVAVKQQPAPKAQHASAKTAAGALASKQQQPEAKAAAASSKATTAAAASTAVQKAPSAAAATPVKATATPKQGAAAKATAASAKASVPAHAKHAAAVKASAVSRPAESKAPSPKDATEDKQNEAPMQLVSKAVKEPPPLAIALKHLEAAASMSAAQQHRSTIKGSAAGGGLGLKVERDMHAKFVPEPKITASLEDDLDDQQAQDTDSAAVPIVVAAADRGPDREEMTAAPPPAAMRHRGPAAAAAAAKAASAAPVAAASASASKPQQSSAPPAPPEPQPSKQQVHSPPLPQSGSGGGSGSAGRGAKQQKATKGARASRGGGKAKQEDAQDDLDALLSEMVDTNSQKEETHGLAPEQLEEVETCTFVVVSLIHLVIIYFVFSWLYSWLSRWWQPAPLDLDDFDRVNK